jgi:hypothetical protein
MTKSILRGVFCLALAAGCGDGGGGTSSGGGGTITLSSAVPVNGSTIRNNNMAADGVRITVSATGITLVDPATRASNVAGEGHYHVYLDSDTGGAYVAIGFTPATDVAIPASKPSGTHTIHVELQDNTHHAVNPGGGGVSGNLFIVVSQ